MRCPPVMKGSSSAVNCRDEKFLNARFVTSNGANDAHIIPWVREPPERRSFVWGFVWGRGASREKHRSEGSRHRLTPYEVSNSTCSSLSWRGTARFGAISSSWRVVDRFLLECAGEIADLNAAAQFSSDQTKNFCNNHQSHSSNNLILHESL